MTPTRLERYALVVAVLACALLAWPLRAYVTDDTFIHLQYARHLAAGDGFVFNPGERVYGSTSPLWVMLLANAMAMGVDGLLASKWLGALATLASLLLWARLVRQTIGDARIRAASLIVWACHAWMSRWSLSGMETPLAVALVLGNEEHGLAPAVEQACPRLVTIPGSGRVESLNVSVAAAILLWELVGKK